MIEKINTTVYRCTCDLPDCKKSWVTKKDVIPNRCRWCGRRTWNHPDSRKSLLIKANGKTQSVSVWSKETGLSKSTITARIKAGRKPSDAVTIPAGNMEAKRVKQTKEL